MRTIWKYQLIVTDVQEIDIPIDSEILSVQVQAGIPCLWVLIHDTESKVHKMKFVTIGTGNPINEYLSHKKFIGTYQISSLVFHVFLDKIK